MLGRQAKAVSPADLDLLLDHIGDGTFAARNRVMVMLSVRGGLRACEIANLTWAMVLRADGKLSDTIDVRSRIAKRQSGRRIPMHPEIKRALRRLWRVCDDEQRLPHRSVIQSTRGSAMKPNSIVNWFVAAYRQIGLEGCSSHSGRRTFITNAARKAHFAGASLRDVQLLAGHRSIETTQRYIDGDSHAQRKLVSLL